ncbi:MAG: glycosyltransferase family 2 protein [Rhodospirillaceae bacterium]|nr:glycosyltransferase family 2 protein [Rhodospirillaceae bacterium]
MSRVRAPSVAVIITAYNAAATLDRTLQSAVDSVAAARDKIPELIPEIAVVDDISTDNTREIITRWAEKHPEIKLVTYEENQGPGFARNEGVRKTTGSYLFFLDSDDVFYPNHVHLCVQHLLENDDLGYVFTKLHVDMTMHEQWRRSIDESNPINFCVRRVWHDMILGFAEEPDFSTYRTEDTLYRLCLRDLVAHEKIDIETCEQFVSPGNALDRQREKFGMSMAEWNATVAAGEGDDGFVLTDDMERVVEARLSHVRNLLGADS